VIKRPPSWGHHYSVVLSIITLILILLAPDQVRFCITPGLALLAFLLFLVEVIVIRSELHNSFLVALAAVLSTTVCMASACIALEIDDDLIYGLELILQR
jgi:hypothetical protein